MLILVIDDDELSRELLTLLLEVEGFTVVPAASGGEGLERLREMDPGPEAVLSDLQMPGISGTELAHALRADLPAEVPIIAMSGSDSRPAGAPDSAPPGFDGFLLKPFQISDLREALVAVQTGMTTAIKPTGLDEQSSLPDREDSAPAINEEVYVKLQDLMPAEQLGQMFALCIADARTRLGAMRALAAAGDDGGFRRESHAIKGGAGMIGAAELYKLAEKAEKSGLNAAEDDVNAGTSGVTASLDRLSRACERLERILVERLKA